MFFLWMQKENCLVHHIISVSKEKSALLIRACIFHILLFSECFWSVILCIFLFIYCTCGVIKFVHQAEKKKKALFDWLCFLPFIFISVCVQNLCSSTVWTCNRGFIYTTPPLWSHSQRVFCMSVNSFCDKTNSSILSLYSV